MPRSVCRVCLSIDVTMCKIAGTPLQTVYEKLTDTPLLAANKPIEVCYVCYADLNKCRMVIVNAIKADNILTGFVERSDKVEKKPASLPEHRTKSWITPQPSTTEHHTTDVSHHDVKVKIKKDFDDTDVQIEFEVFEDSETNKRNSTPINSPEKSLSPKKTRRETGVILRECDTARNEVDKPEPPRNRPREKGEELISCHICRCTFTHMVNLKKHLLSHSAEEYECHVCHRVFKNRGNLKMHIRSHRDK